MGVFFVVVFFLFLGRRGGGRATCRWLPLHFSHCFAFPSSPLLSILSPMPLPLFPAALPSPSLSKLNPANLTSWTVEDVGQWLTEHGLGQFVEVFQENLVDGECLMSLDNTLLKEDLKITALGHRSRIMKRVTELKMSVHPAVS